MAKKSKKKSGGILNTISTLLIVLLAVVGLICFFAVDASGGVSVAATTTVLENLVGVGFTFFGLTAVFGGSTKYGTFAIAGDKVSDVTDPTLSIELNANYGVIIGLIVLVIATILIALLRKNKFGMLIGTILLVVGSILLLCGGQFFSSANADTIGGLTGSKYGSITYLDIGSLVAGVFGIVASLIALIQTIVVLVRR